MEKQNDMQCCVPIIISENHFNQKFRQEIKYYNKKKLYLHK